MLLWRYFPHPINEAGASMPRNRNRLRVLCLALACRGERGR